MMRISKIDTISIELVRVKNPNPLNSLDVELEKIFIGEDQELDQGKVKLDSDEVGEALQALYKGKFLNHGEQIPMPLRDGKLIVKVIVRKLESIDQALKQTFGIINEHTIVNAKVGQKSAHLFRCMSSSQEEKQIFKTNMNF